MPGVELYASGVWSEMTDRAQPGFTLVELLVVVAILATLMAMLLPVLGRAREKGRAAVCLSNLHQVALAFEMYRSDHRDIYPAAEDPVHENPTYWLWMGRGFRGFLQPYLVPNINADNPSVLACPSDPTPAQRYEKTSYAYSMAFYHTPAQINAMSSFEDTFRDPVPTVGQSATRVRFPDRKILAGEWASYHRPLEDDRGWWDWRGTRQYLFADSHATAVVTRRILPARDGFPDANLTIDGVRGRDR